MSSDSAPTFSVVTAVYGVADYLPDFIASLEAQTYPLDRVEVIAVDDGSVDGSAEILEAWARRRPDLVRVVRQENAGQGAARNHGIELARGEWITFPDPDDVLVPGYLRAVADFLEQHPETDLVATHRLMWSEDTGEITNSHPLRSMFRTTSLVAIDRSGLHFHGSAPAAFFRLDRLCEQGVRFDGRIRPNFEDGHFTSHYLLRCEDPKVGFVHRARYHYRKRSASTASVSSTQGSRSHLGRYSDVMEHGYLDVVRYAEEHLGQVPAWLANYLVYDLHWYFTATDPQAEAGVPMRGGVAERYHDLMGEVLSHLDLDTAVPNITAPVGRIPRFALQHGYSEIPWHEEDVVLERLDRSRHLVKVSWFFSGPPPAEEFRAADRTLAPLHAKTRQLVWSGRTLLRQRVVWLPQNEQFEVLLDGRRQNLVYERPPLPALRSLPARTMRKLGPPGEKRLAEARAELEPTPTTTLGKAAKQLAHRRPARTRYRDAWVLMDRLHDAGDSGEILFRHLREHRDDINAFFVIEKDTSDFRRLKAEFGDRVIARGTLAWRLLMANAEHLLSSHADLAVMRPEEIWEFTKPEWSFTFLQHGVIKDDLSGWLNPKVIDTLVTSSQGEHDSIAGDSGYVFSTLETKLTGLPRFDRLLEVGARFPPERRDLVLLVPTWRSWLTRPLALGSQRHDADASMVESEFVQEWMRLLRDDSLAERCRDEGLQLAFLPHPNLQPLLGLLDLPAHVLPLTYDGNDVQEFFARARVLVTDFSSIAFNAAYLERPVVYYQFDEEQMLDGGHTGVRGYFDYRRDGFGPVTGDSDEAVRAILESIAAGPGPSGVYAERIEATFPDRDGRCCERVVEAVLASRRDQSGAEPTPTPVAPRATVAT